MAYYVTDHYVGSASDLPYGRGYKAAEEQLNELLGGLDPLRNDKNMTVIVLSRASRPFPSLKS